MKIPYKTYKEIPKFKICGHCNIEYPYTKEFFYNSKNEAFGLGYVCKNCVKKYKNKCKQERAKNKLCKDCNNVVLDNSTFCIECYLKYKARANTGSSKNWNFLFTLLEKQNYKCPYTGDKIILGLNDAIDHILPKSKYAELKNNLNNLQWVTRELNYRKMNYTEQEFLDIIKQIVEYKNLS